MCLNFQADFLPSFLSVFGLRDYKVQTEFIPPANTSCAPNDVQSIYWAATKMGASTLITRRTPDAPR
jgi:hypothetical protein